MSLWSPASSELLSAVFFRGIRQVDALCRWDEAGGLG